jgi:ankyrin repeat protein
MEPKTKKSKHNPTGLHDAIVQVDYNLRFICNHNGLLNLFRKNMNVAKIKDANGNYPLYLIFRYRSDYLNDPLLIKLVLELLYHYPDAICQECWDDFVTNPLHVAAEEDNDQLVLVILTKNISLLNKLDEDRRTPLQVACRCKSRKAVETILQFPDVMVNNVDVLGKTALFCESEWRIIYLLLQYPGIDVEVTDGGGNSAFRLFLEFVNQMKYKNTKRSKVFRVVKIFMNCPGVLRLKSGFGENILHDIVNWNNPHLLSVLFSFNTDLLINWDEQTDKQGKTALHKACEQMGSERSKDPEISTTYLECLNMLLSNADDITINKQDHEGETALHYACRWENNVAVKALLEIPGIDLTIYNYNGNTPLFTTICKSEDYFNDRWSARLRFSDINANKAWDLKCIRLLLNHNECLILARNERGYRILDLARNRLQQITNGDLANWFFQSTRDDLITDLNKIIDELEYYMTKARWKMFQYIHKNVHLSINQHRESVEY